MLKGAPVALSKTQKLPTKAPQMSKDIVSYLQSSVKTGLGSTDFEVPVQRKISAENQILFDQWLNAMSERLMAKIVNTDARLDLLKTVWYESRRAGLDPGMVLGLIEVESNFNVQNEQTGRVGLLGVERKWPTLIGDGDVKRLTIIRPNLRYGCSILSAYIEMNDGDLFLALSQYDRSYGRLKFPNKVLTAWRMYQYKGAT